MNPRFSILALFVTLASPALADGPMTQQELQDYCSKSWQHKPDSSIYYKPEPTGKHRPATLQPQLEVKPEDIAIPLEIPLENYVPNPSAYHVDLSQTHIWLGDLSFDAGGNLLLNGKALPSQALDALCQSQRDEK